MSKISWTNITLNPIHLVRADGSHGGHWCQKVSPECLHCYAENQNQSNYFRFASHLNFSGAIPENMILDEKVLQPLIKSRSPKKVFICSMTDLFGSWVSDEWLDIIFAYMALAKQHTFQVLTKRPERMLEYLKSGARQRIRIATVDVGRKLNLKPEMYEPYETFDFEWPLENVWLGVSVGNQTATSRIPYLIKTPAAVRFLSCEPLLELVDLSAYLPIEWSELAEDWIESFPGIEAYQSKLHWVIIGGESGTGARPCHLDWLRSIVQQCNTAKVSVFVKQLGSVAIDSNDYIVDVAVNNFKLKLKDRKGGDIDEFPDNLKVRSFPN